MKYPVKAMRLDELLNVAITLFKDHFTLLLTISCILLVPTVVLMDVLALPLTTAMQDLGAQPKQDEVFDLFRQSAVLLMLLGVLLLFYLMVAIPVTQAAIAQAMASKYLEWPTTAGSAIRHGLSVFFPLVGAMSLVFLVTLGGVLVVFIPTLVLSLVTKQPVFAILGGFAAIFAAFYLHLRFWLVPYAVVLERATPFQALRRGAALLKGSMLIALVLFFVTMAINLLSGLITAVIPVQVIQIPVSIVLQALLAAFLVVLQVVLYFSCRCKLENFDLTLLAESVARDEGFPTPQDTF